MPPAMTTPASRGRSARRRGASLAGSPSGDARQMHGGEADAGAEIEQSGGQPGIEGAQQQLRQRRAGAEQHGRGEGEDDAAATGKLHGPDFDKVRDALPVGCEHLGARSSAK